ncbi:MAG: hypothetical protein ACREEI_12465 [Stellaceae bacterium]
MRTEKKDSFFESAKTGAPIPISAPLVAEAVVLFSLDPAVRRIEYLREMQVRGQPVRLDAVVLVGDGARELLEFPEIAAPRDIDQAGLALLAIDQLGLTVRQVTEAEIRSEPRATNVRMVWGCRAKRVHVDDRVRLLELLGEEGPMALSRAAAAMQFARGAISAVLALACADLIEIELGTAPLGPQWRPCARLVAGNRA